jgi:energy-coupling factor transport system permease protein
VTIALYGQSSGATYLHWALVHVTDGSLALALATALRILAIGIPAVILFTGIDATALADGLAQLLHLPARFVLGALAAFRLVGLIAEDWRSLALARRARGVADRGALRRFAGQAFALLVLALRRGTKLATAMEARGFGAWVTRTWARPSSFGRAEWALVGLGAVVVIVAVGASVATGHWRFVGA